MPAVLYMVPPIKLEAVVGAAPTFMVRCTKCRWMPAAPLDEADARIEAYQHNAEKHPDASVEIHTIAQLHAEQKQWLRSHLIPGYVVCGVGVGWLVMLLVLHGLPWYSVLSTLGLVVAMLLNATAVGYWRAQLSDHERLAPPEPPESDGG